MNQELIYKKNINKLMSLTNFEYDKDKKRPPGFHLDRVNFMMKKSGLRKCKIIKKLVKLS
jgi:hypothetical protein